MKFIASSGEESCTSRVSIIENLNWFDKEGYLTLIDCPGLKDSKHRDQHFLD